MKNIFYSVGLLAIVLGLSLTSCTTDTINKLQGVWTVVQIPEPGTSYVETWEFTNDGRLLVKNSNPAYGDKEGKYSVEAKFLETRLTITDFPNQNNFYNAEWWIVELKRNTLYIVHDKDGGLYNREFER